ncbi:MAG: hypothetical protein PHP97_01915 [Candidatus Shapirobacteria bacterium]|nr:hypothetical protein [Candidatus Shapirobacteria bacterium]MDD3002985.1 hypothetical protein [Candidatus Shapirobacteria bacterium]MDD4383178.1 hypothetical protein [Candidatus Shapirobacteria bacterium]
MKKIVIWFRCESMVRCAKCGGIIIPGDPITLHEREDGLTPKNVVVFEGKSVCCFRKGCRGNHKIDGYWTSSGVEVNFFSW